jgi:hypothetical protein
MPQRQALGPCGLPGCHQDLGVAQKVKDAVKPLTERVEELEAELARPGRSGQQRVPECTES